MQTTLTAAIIIPTYNRPDELAACVASILGQERLPAEVIIVDDGATAPPAVEASFREAGIKYTYIRKDCPGLTESRIAGVRAATSDIIMFLDDDVELYPGYVTEVLRLFESDPAHEVGGVGGCTGDDDIPQTFSRWLRFILEFIFRNTGKREGRVLRSGFCTDFGTTWWPLRKLTDVQFLPGAASSYRREVFDVCAFTPEYRKFALGEDKFFSHEVSLHYRLLYSPWARLDHHEARAMRPDKFRWGHMFMLGRYYFFRRFVRHHWWDWLFFWYAAFGSLFVRTLMGLSSRNRANREEAKGVLAACREILSGSVPQLGSKCSGG
jgi:GT2 family glycosyltransferase